MKLADIVVGMDAAIRTAGVTADDIRSGRNAVLGTVTHVGKYRLAKQGLCEVNDVVLADYAGASNCVVVRLPQRLHSYRNYSRKLVDGDGHLRPSEHAIVESGQIYPIGLFLKGVEDRKLVMSERSAYLERMSAILEQLNDEIPSVDALIAEGLLKRGSLRIDTYARFNNTTGKRYRVGEARLAVSEVGKLSSIESNPLWQWLQTRQPQLTTEYDDLFRRVNECSL